MNAQRASEKGSSMLLHIISDDGIPLLIFLVLFLSLLVESFASIDVDKFDGDGGVRALPSNEVYDDSEVSSAKAELLSRIATSSSSSSSSSSLSSPLPLRRFSLLVLVEE